MIQVSAARECGRRRGRNDATVLQVYVGLPAGADPSAHPEHRAGSVGLFGVRKASRGDGEHAGQGLTYVLEITDAGLQVGDTYLVTALVAEQPMPAGRL